MSRDAVARAIVSADRSNQPEVGMRQGTLLSWDPSTGNNTVLVAGQVLEDLPVLAAGSVAMAVGDVVALQRFGNSYFILGAVRNAGTGSLQIRSATVLALAGEHRASTAWGDLATPGPTLTNVYIGGSRQCLVLLRASITPNANAEVGYAGLEVTGASSIGAGTVDELSAYIGGVNGVAGSATSSTVIDASKGLHTGFNTFTMKYRTLGGADVIFASRTITVIPF